jgi:hypothetical protein
LLLQQLAQFQLLLLLLKQQGEAASQLKALVQPLFAQASRPKEITLARQQ